MGPRDQELDRTACSPHTVCTRARARRKHNLANLIYRGKRSTLGSAEALLACPVQEVERAMIKNLKASHTRATYNCSITVGRSLPLVGG
eukprot:5520237-Pyramimonas_sp.AAC.3